MDRKNVNRKLQEVFPEVVIDKKLTQISDIKRLPRFISEYIILKLCGNNPTQEDLKKIRPFIKKYYPDKSEKNKIRTFLMKYGEYKLLDEFRVETDIQRGIQKLYVPSIDLSYGTINPSLLYEHENLLIDGVWGIGTLNYLHDTEIPVVMSDFSPFQVSALNMTDFYEGREIFNLSEWVDVLVETIGMNTESYTDHQKLIFLTRMIPLVESNVNMIELGPKGTGKTYLYSNISQHTRVISGGTVTPPTLFWHLVTNRPGLLVMKDCVVFDEVSTLKFKNPNETIGKLKNYMESGNFDRGDKEVHSTTSIVFVGNLKIGAGGVPASSYLFNELPRDMQEPAFLDRLHGFIPGWELKRIQTSRDHLAKGYGFVVDYFAEILHRLRLEDISTHISSHIELQNADIRDEKSIIRLVCGLVKILFPNDIWTEKDLELCLSLAIQYRQQVINQLHIIDAEEFKKKKIEGSIL